MLKCPLCKHYVNVRFLSERSPAHLWRQVLRGPTEGLHGGRVCDPLFAKSEICDFYVAIFIQHQILQLHRKKNDMIILQSSNLGKYCLETIMNAEPRDFGKRT